MAGIANINEAWEGHSGTEVEQFLKSQLTRLAASLGGKFGHVAFNSQTMTVTFYDEAGGTPLGSVQLGGQIYTIEMSCNLSQVFYVLADEAQKTMTITPSTTVSAFGSSTSEDYPESYTYVVAVNSGAGYVDRVTGSIATGGNASFDIRPYLSTGDNYIRVAVTGASSGQTRTTVFTGTLTTLTMSCNHAWQNVWTQGQDYNITGIRFAGNLVKQLHVSLDNVELESVSPVTYSASQSYTTTATYFTIPASAFPSGGSAVHSVKLWMTAQGVSTPVISYNIMCAATGDTTPLVAINAISAKAYNFTSGTIFSYSVYNANKVSIALSATLNSVNYPITTGVVATDREEGVQYPFAYSLEVDTGANETQLGSLGISATAYQNTTEGNTATASTIFDNTYSYLATPGYLFYLNAATRDNGTTNYDKVVNEAGASQDGNFAASYNAVWNGLSWYNDGWGTDPSGYKALNIPAGCTVTVTDFKPLNLLSSYNGMTFEFMLQCASPSDYSATVFSISDTSNGKARGIKIYPTKITVWGEGVQDEDFQTVNFSENAMTHICITFLKEYEGQSGKNLCSVYVNGISNVCFAFDGGASFGAGSLVIGQQNTDAYLYKMRVYGSALEPRAVFNNFLNSIVDGVEFNRNTLNAKNNVLDGSSVNYDLVKAAGLNTIVVTTPNNVPIPSYFNQVTVNGCTVRFEYAADSTKNATVSNVSMDGQGTTSKKYFRWNLRWKTSDATNWSYGDGTSSNGKKAGRMINDSNYIEVDRITAKKNIASSPQGHKMGLTGLYNDLFHQIGLNAELPDPTYRVAVYQFPFVGFQYNSTNGSYEYIGIYTAGPDKGSKKTFGYASSYTDLLSIEGPNHNPRGTRFLTPWVDVTYDPEQETLCFGGEEGWDADYVKWETSTKGTQTDWDNILALYESQWRPAYNCVYDNSPYLASAAEVIAGLDNENITTLEHLLLPANATTVKAGTTNGMPLTNEYIAFYDSSYDLYFFRRSTGKFEKLPNDYTGKKNALTDLSAYLTDAEDASAPTTAELIAARAARFKATMTDYFSQNQTLYHYCFCLLYGVTDNFAKNSYPFKFKALSATGAGNRWGWRQDDLDSVLMTDNNGTNTKKYSVEHGDTASNVQVFQGGTSALWVLIRDYYQDECAVMMGQIASAAASLATALGVAGSGLHESLFNLTSYYCWDHSAKYFPATIYESDRRWAYIEPWLIAGETIPDTSELYPATYNGVAPLTQAVGDQLQGEKLWMLRRIAYIFSKYRLGAFHGDNSGYGMLAFTLASSFTFSLTPAIDLYPVISVGSEDSQAGRTVAGTAASVEIGTTGDTTNYLHGLDWLASMGDLSGMALTSRGTSEAIVFSITAARLQSLKIGDETAANVAFNATSFSITSPSVASIDARNTATITNIVNLLGCPRLRVCKFAGSGAAGLYLPVGAKLTEVSFPSGATTVFMHSLPFLTNANLTLPALAGITSLYINNCANLEPFAIAASILGTTGNTLAYVTLLWRGIVSGDVSTILALTAMAGYVSFENNSPSTVGGAASIEGTVQLAGLYADQLDQLGVVSSEDYGTGLKKCLSNLFNSNFYIIYDPNTMWIRFADPNVESVCVTNWDTSGDGHLTTTEAAAATGSLSTIFNGNTTITSFNELRYFTGLTSIYGADTSPYGAFAGCTSLKEITIPKNVSSIGQAAFRGCTALQTVTFTRTSNTGGGQQMFRGCSSLSRIILNGSISANYTDAFIGCSNLKRVDVPSIDVWLGCTFHATVNGAQPFLVSQDGHLYINDVEVTSVEIPSTRTSIGIRAFAFCKGITSITIPSGITTIGAVAFNGCSGLANIVVPASVTTLGNSAFANLSSTAKVTIKGNISSLGTALFENGCNEVVFENQSNVNSTVIHNCGAQSVNSIFRTSGNVTKNSANTYYLGRFGKYYIGGNLNQQNAGAILGNAYNRELHIGGNINCTNSSAATLINASGVRLKFVEVGGTITNAGAIIGTNGNGCADGFIWHFAKTDGIACSATVATVSYSRVSKVYVGDGSSEANDQAVKDLYLADADWAQYASKLDLWYNYSGEFKQTT